MRFSASIVNESHKHFLQSCYRGSFPTLKARTKFCSRPRQEPGKHFQYNLRGLCRKIETLWLTGTVSLSSQAIQFVEFPANLEIGQSGLVSYFNRNSPGLTDSIPNSYRFDVDRQPREHPLKLSQWMPITWREIPYSFQFLTIHWFFSAGFVRKRYVWFHGSIIRVPAIFKVFKNLCKIRQSVFRQ